MLRVVTIENFVRFKERVYLKFEEGANFIIGGNSTGKSSVFELIRRCYSKSINTSDSNVFNDTKIAYTVCSYDSIEGITFDGEKIDKLFSSYIIEPGGKKLKILGVKIGNEVKIAGITAKRDKDVVNFCFEYSDKDEWMKNIMSISSQDSKNDMSSRRQDRMNDISKPSRDSKNDMSNLCQDSMGGIQKPSRDNKNDMSSRRQDSMDDISKPSRDNKNDMSNPSQDGKADMTNPSQDSMNDMLKTSQDSKNDMSSNRQDSMDDILKPSRDSKNDMSNPSQGSKDDMTNPSQDSMNDMLKTSQDSKNDMLNPCQDSMGGIPTPSMDDIKHLMSLPGVTNQHKTEKLEGPLLDVFQKLTESFVNTFAMRSIGPLQWNKSKHLTNHDENYTEANERAEILHKLLPEQENDDYFESMMSPKKVEFNIDSKNKIYVIIDGKTKTPVKILKISEGIIEAKELSLILKHEHYRTICLEEPDHGMHPQLIERMRNCVLRVVKGKTVIIVSHHPSLLNKWALERTHVCIQGDDARSSTIHKPNFIGKNYAECEEIKKLLFSSHVLLVEGDSDAICIQALLDLCEDIDWISKEELRNCQKVQIIKLFSKHNYRNVSQICTKLKIKHMVLLDSDALQTEELRQILFRDKDDTGLPTVRYNEHIGLPTDTCIKKEFKMKCKENYREIKDKLKDNVFVWREGNLEDVTGEKKKTWWQDKTSDQIKEKVKKLLGKPDEDKSFNLLLKAIVKYFQEKNEK